MFDAHYAGTWTTSPEAEFINSLCPNGQPPFPHFRQFDAETNQLISQAFARGFSQVRHIWFQKNYQAPRVLTLGENMVWQAIGLKTIRFNKLCEKLPRRLFTRGHLRPDNQLLMDDYNLPVLPSTGLDDSGLSKALRGLLAKRGWITRLESDPHPIYGASSIYSAVPLDEAIETMLSVVLSEVVHDNDPRRRWLCDEVLSRLETMMAKAQ
jgi:hypothetical protein